MIVKYVIAGEYTAPPAHGPMMAEIHALARRQFAGLVLTIETILTSAELGAAIEISQGVEWIAHAFTACAFSQSFRNFSNPILVRGWLKS